MLTWLFSVKTKGLVLFILNFYYNFNAFYIILKNDPFVFYVLFAIIKKKLECIHKQNSTWFLGNITGVKEGSLLNSGEPAFYKKQQ